MHTNLKEMHDMVNLLYKKQIQLKKLVSTWVPNTVNKEVKIHADSLIKDLKDWDEDMVQRKSKAYDDVENFPNKFSSDYLYLINQSENEWYRLNDSSKELKEEMDAKWDKLKNRALNLKNIRIPELNKKLWEVGVGALWE
jgi:hypothetical protein